MAFVLVVIGARLLDDAAGPSPVSPVALPTSSADAEPEPGRPTRRTPGPRPEETRAEPEPTRTRPAINRSLRGNTVYRAGALPTVRCPGGSASIYDHAQLKALILKTSRCLNRQWHAALSRVGIEWHAPGYAIAARRGRGACGDYPQRGSIVPYYCPRNTTIYASTSAMAGGSGTSLGYGEITPWHGAIISMMAHEYGHHVQYLTGITDAWWRQTLQARSQSTRLALSRRLELQATCLAGMFMRAVAPSYPVTPARRQTLFYFYSRVGDWPGYPRDHGSPANNHRWFRQGFEKNRTHQCNTWRAPAAAVS